MCSKTMTQLSICDDETLIKDILKPLTYTTPNHRNSIEHRLLKLLAHWIEVPDAKMPLLDDLIFYIYNSALLVDDMYDDAILRRGKPTAHKVFGIIRTMTTVNLSLITIYDIILKLDNQVLLNKIIAKFPKMLAGEGLELYWRDNNICPTEKQFLNMMYFKSAVPFMLIAEVLSIFGKRDWTLYKKLMEAFGYFYQINNDYQNLCNKDYHAQKGFCEDLTEGKFSHTVVHAINNFPKEGKIIQEILEERTTDLRRKKYCLSLLEKCGSLAYTKKVLDDLKGIMFAEIRKIEDDPMLRQFLETSVLQYL